MSRIADGARESTSGGNRRAGERRVRLRTVVLLGVLAVLAVGSAAAMTVPAGQTLRVTDAETGQQLLAVPVHDGSTVTVAYTHSVERTPVRDIYRVSDRRLTMTRMEFSSYGYGLPARADVEIVDGQFVTYPDWSGQVLTVKPGHIAGHRLVVDGVSYDLVAVSNAETVTISVDRETLADRLFDRSSPAQHVTATIQDHR